MSSDSESLPTYVEMKATAFPSSPTSFLSSQNEPLSLPSITV